MADTVVQELIINTLTQAQFDAAKEAGTLSPYELYGTPDTSADIDLSNITDGGRANIANVGMPSGTYTDLTLGASGNSYTAPADGWVAIGKTTSAAGQYLELKNQTSLLYAKGISHSTQSLFVFVPVRQGDVVNVVYNADGTTSYFRFIYAEGARHLA